MIARRTRRRTSLKQHVMNMLVVVALALTSFAHQPLATTSAAATVDLAAYALPDGSLPDICLFDTGTGGNDAHGHALCDFCLISGGSLAAENTPALAMPVPVAASNAIARASHLPRSDDLTVRPLRGPPFRSA